MFESTMAQEETAETNYRRLPKDLAGMLRDQLEAQSEFSSLMGSVLGQFLWDLTKCPHIACTLAHKKRVGEMLEVTRSAIMCYSALSLRSSQNRPETTPSQDETRLALSLAGITANLAAVAPSVLVSCGRNLIQDIIRIIPNLTFQPLNKVLLDLLFNLSLDEAGAARLLERDVMKALNKVLFSEPDIRMSGLKLLASLTSRDMPPFIASMVPVEKVKTLYQNGDAEMGHYANMVLKNMIPYLE